MISYKLVLVKMLYRIQYFPASDTPDIIYVLTSLKRTNIKIYLSSISVFLVPCANECPITFLFL